MFAMNTEMLYLAHVARHADLVQEADRYRLIRAIVQDRARPARPGRDRSHRQDQERCPAADRMTTDRVGWSNKPVAPDLSVDHDPIDQPTIRRPASEKR